MQGFYATLVVAAFVAGLAAAPPQTPTQMVFRSGVDLVYVTATVADRDGRFVAGLTANWIGCATDSEPVQTSQSEPTSSETVLVSLSVPNMT